MKFGGIYTFTCGTGNPAMVSEGASNTKYSYNMKYGLSSPLKSKFSKMVSRLVGKVNKNQFKIKNYNLNLISFSTHCNNHKSFVILGVFKTGFCNNMDTKTSHWDHCLCPT
jgi:hypothetical protein